MSSDIFGHLDRGTTGPTTLVSAAIGACFALTNHLHFEAYCGEDLKNVCLI